MKALGCPRPRRWQHMFGEAATAQYRTVPQFPHLSDEGVGSPGAPLQPQAPQYSSSQLRVGFPLTASHCPRSLWSSNALVSSFMGSGPEERPCVLEVSRGPQGVCPNPEWLPTGSSRQRASTPQGQPGDPVLSFSWEGDRLFSSRKGPFPRGLSEHEGSSPLPTEAPVVSLVGGKAAEFNNQENRSIRQACFSSCPACSAPLEAKLHPSEALQGVGEKVESRQPGLGAHTLSVGAQTKQPPSSSVWHSTSSARAGRPPEPAAVCSEHRPCPLGRTGRGGGGGAGFTL